MTTTATDLLSALDMVAFARQPDGTFRALTEAPAWFRILTADLTFPFLGAFLETAGTFWAESKEGCVWSGPCAQADETGKDFHFEVAAVTTAAGQYLVFERRPEVEAMQHVLQKAREIALDHERLTGRFDNMRATQAGALAELVKMAQRAAELASELSRAPVPAAQQPLVSGLADATTRVVAGIETTLRSLGQRRTST